jgi:hypothetical protein
MNRMNEQNEPQKYDPPSSKLVVDYGELSGELSVIDIRKSFPYTAPITKQSRTL